MTVHQVPAATTETVGQWLVELDELARAERAMADGCPTAEQELLLMSVGSLAHRARRQPSIAVRPRDGLLRRWLRRSGGAR
ncbi:hypothetical protein [Kutzneria sp. NPDC051319]|uniref:hypothetical protein n=1 Tax=Kutzneria sp. NPDC051319 TaxID=3155047 RepID=UPI00342B92FB